MAHQAQLTEWILRNDERLNLQVQELSWIKSIFPNWYDLQASISVFGERFIGRGSDSDAHTALGKAVCEAVERATCFRHGISSLGVAGHLSLELAQANARLEYIERFCMSRQVEERIFLAKLSDSKAICERNEKRGVAVRFYRLASPEKTPVVLCLANGENADPPFGGILGLGAALSEGAAYEKALLECLRNLEFYFHAKPASLASADFQKIAKPKAQDRQALLRDLTYFRQLMASLDQPAPVGLTVPEGKFEGLSLDAAFGDCPLVFTRYSASVPLAQPEFLA
ncbi:MAG: YcaO-like family protein [Bacteriovoracia bacterium]